MARHERGTLAGEVEYHLEHHGVDRKRYDVLFCPNGYWSHDRRETSLIIATDPDVQEGWRVIAHAVRDEGSERPFHVILHRLQADSQVKLDLTKADAARLLVLAAVSHNITHAMRDVALDNESDIGEPSLEESSSPVPR